MSETVAVLLAALFGGVGIKMLEAVINRTRNRADMQRDMRDELRQEVISLRSTIDDIDARLDEWRARYYNLQAAFDELYAASIVAGFMDEARKIKEKYGE